MVCLITVSGLIGFGALVTLVVVLMFVICVLSCLVWLDFAFGFVSLFMW